MGADLSLAGNSGRVYERTRGPTIAGHDAVIYDFEVDREHSHWHIQAPSQSVQAGLQRKCWLEKDTAEILRIEMQTYRMPKEFHFDKVESAVDYDYVRLGGLGPRANSSSPRARQPYPTPIGSPRVPKRITRFAPIGRARRRP